MHKKCDNSEGTETSISNTLVAENEGEKLFNPELARAIHALHEAYFSQKHEKVEYENVRYNSTAYPEKPSSGTVPRCIPGTPDGIVVSSKKQTDVLDRTQQQQRYPKEKVGENGFRQQTDLESQSSFSTVKSRVSNWMSKLFSNRPLADVEPAKEEIKTRHHHLHRFESAAPDWIHEAHINNGMGFEQTIPDENASRYSRTMYSKPNDLFPAPRPCYVYKKWHEMPHLMFGDNENFGRPVKSKNQNGSKEDLSPKVHKEKHGKSVHKGKKSPKSAHANGTNIGKNNQKIGEKAADGQKLHTEKVGIFKRDSFFKKEKKSKQAPVTRKASEEASSKRPRSEQALRAQEDSEVNFMDEKEKKKWHRSKRDDTIQYTTREPTPVDTGQSPGNGTAVIKGVSNQGGSKSKTKSQYLLEDSDEDRKKRNRRSRSESLKRENKQSKSNLGNQDDSELVSSQRANRRQRYDDDRSEVVDRSRSLNPNHSHSSSRLDSSEYSHDRSTHKHRRHGSQRHRAKYNGERSISSCEMHRQREDDECCCNRHTFHRHRHHYSPRGEDENGRASSARKDRNHHRPRSHNQNTERIIHSVPTGIRRQYSLTDRDECKCSINTRRRGATDVVRHKCSPCSCNSELQRMSGHRTESRCSRPDDELIEVLSEMCSELGSRLCEEAGYGSQDSRTHTRIKSNLRRYLSPDTLTLLEASEHPSPSRVSYRRRGCCDSFSRLPPVAPRYRPSEAERENITCYCSPNSRTSNKLNNPNVNVCPMYYPVPQPVSIPQMAVQAPQPPSTWYPAPTSANVYVRPNPVSLISPHQINPSPSVYNPYMMPSVTSPAIQSSMLFPSFGYCQRM